MITITDLEKYYATEEVRTIALNKLSFKVSEGEFVAIMGPSGCGKSTLLNILGLLDDPDGGSFVFNGIEVAGFNERKRADLRKHNIGFVFQSFNLIDELTVYENIETPLLYKSVKSNERKALVGDMLDRFNIVGKKDLFPNQLSGGQQQLVGIARALISKPKLILADEPTGNLNSKQSDEIMQLFKQLNEEDGVTIIQATHSESNAAYASKIINLLDGSIAKS